MPKALDLGSGEEAPQLPINKNYADRYNKWRSAEVLQKLKDKHGNVSLADGDDDSESSESEPEWTAEDEKDFFRTLGALKTNDPKIYDKSSTFFQAKAADAAEKPKKGHKTGEKGMTLRDYEVALVQDRKGKFDDEDDAGAVRKGTPELTYSEKSKKLVEDLKKAAAAEASDEDDEDDGLLRKRVKTKQEIEKEEEDFAAWLASSGSKDIGLAPDDTIRKLKDEWVKPDIDAGDAFLRDYILQKQYDVDEAVEKDELPSYDEIVQIEEDIDEMERFEHKYNFRFEEPDKDFIKQYPRTVKESIRKETSKRKEKREDRLQRKEEEKKQFREEVRMLKDIKKKQIEDKLKKLRAVAGDDSLPITLEDLEKDFDPAEYDAKMKELFPGDYYEQADTEKPVFSDDSEDEGSDYDNLDVANVKAEDTAGSDDEEHEAEAGPVQRPPTDGKRKRKRNSAFKELVKKPKPVFDPNEKTFDEYLREYYDLDYEDILPDKTRTKFKYRNVQPNDFGLSVTEILEADDKQLNRWCSVKKASQYRTDREEQYDVQAYQRKAANPVLKAKIFGSDELKAPKSGPKREDGTAGVAPKSKKAIKKKKFKAKASKKAAQKVAGVDVSRLKAYNLSNRQINRRIYGKNAGQNQQGGAKKKKAA